MVEEEWRVIDQAPNYEISNTYKVRRAKSGRPLIDSRNHRRPRVGLRVDGETKYLSVEELVQAAFGDNHIDYHERWRQVESAPDYQVSDKGRVRNRRTGRVLRPYTLRSGAQQVTMMVDGYKLTRQIHNLVKEAFDW